MQRPQVYPALARAWRDAASVQWGVPGQRGLVLGGLSQDDDAVLDALDGVHDLRALRRVAASRALPPERADRLVGLLDDAGVLVDGPSRGGACRADRADLSALPTDVLRRWSADADAWALAYDTGSDGLDLLLARQRRHVAVDGAGRLGALLATTLAAAGVGVVSPRDDRLVRPQDVAPGGHRPADVGAPRAGSARQLLASWSAGPRPGMTAPPSGSRHPDVVVLVRDDVVDVREADRLLAADQVHLAVVCAADRVSIGPLVVPGRGPCLRCLDLHRQDRDPAWAQVAAQLGDAIGRARGEYASTVVAAGVAALQVLVHLDGQVRPSAAGHTLDVLLPDGLTERRRWPAHPACGCAVAGLADDEG